MQIGKKTFDFAKHTYVMGILNVTPDSFSDGGKWNKIDRALSHAEEMVRDGVAIIDVGGESTRPGYTKISDEEEIERVSPFIEALKARFDLPISIDTYKSKVAEAAAEAGADLINDIWGLKHDAKMAEVIAKRKLPCCLMHNKEEAVYQNFVKDLMTETMECVRLAKAAGIGNEQIILDPGIGFGKTYEHNLEAIRHLQEFCALGYPVLLGTSRKSVIGLTLDLPAAERVEGTLATSVMAVENGCAFVRVHDVKENVRAIKMTEAILGR